MLEGWGIAQEDAGAVKTLFRGRVLYLHIIHYLQIHENSKLLLRHQMLFALQDRALTY